MVEGEHPVGSGPSVQVGVGLPKDTAEAVRAITGDGEFSAYIAEAVEHRLHGDLIAQDLADHQEEHGAFTEAERAWARAELTGERPGTLPPRTRGPQQG